VTRSQGNEFFPPHCEERVRAHKRPANSLLEQRRESRVDFVFVARGQYSGVNLAGGRYRFSLPHHGGSPPASL